jgi:hypothetical protein
MEHLTEQQEKEWQEYETERYYEEQQEEMWYLEMQAERNSIMDNLRWEEEFGDDYL